MKKTINYIDVLADGQDFSQSFLDISLAKLTGKKIKDIIVDVSEEFGDPTLRIRYIVFEDGSKAHCNGEHDIAYIEDDVPNVNETTLEALKKADDIFSGYGKEGESPIATSWDEKNTVEVILPEKPPKKTGFTIIELVMTLGVLTIFGLVGWVIIHFLSKIW